MSARILIVDDESVTRRLVTFTLKSINVESVSAENGLQAIDFAEQGQFDLALVDINLPDIDGFEVVERLKQIDHMRDVPILMFTARSHQGDELRAQEVGAVGFFYKPFSTQDLRDLVRRYTA